MGYKRAGFNLLGNVEIDEKINEMYVKNHHPKYNYCIDLRDFNKIDDLPEELYHLDILDGSPPCSTFSTAGLRERAWGKEKRFAEGQKLQTLDDLFFVFLETVEKLNPKIVVAENVTGIIKGNAKGYVTEIVKAFKELGYDVQIFRLNGAYMELPQARERVFFVANRMGYDKLKLNFNYKPIPFGEVRSEQGKVITEPLKVEYAQLIRKGDKSLADVDKRVRNKNFYFGTSVQWDDSVCCTITTRGDIIRAYDKMLASDQDIINCSSFPQDYDFCGSAPKYVCGMSVPPNMMAHIANQIWEQWLKK